MKKILTCIFVLFAYTFACAQTVTTKKRCHFLTDEFGLAKLYEITLEEAKIGTIPKGKILPVLEVDTIKGSLIKVQYNNKIGWIHRDVTKDQFVINYQLTLSSVSLNGVEQSLHPTEEMYYEDANIAIKWGKGIGKLIFILHNKSNRGISINWNNSSWVGTDLTAERFMHTGVKYTERESEQTNTFVPPNSKIDEIVLPNSLVYYDEYLGWRENSLLLFTGKFKNDVDKCLEKHLGENVKVLLFLEQGKSTFEYNFTFDLDKPIVKKINN